MKTSMPITKIKYRTEFSKKILYVVWISTTIVVALAFVLMWRTGDLSPLSYIISGLFAEVAASTGFYYWKAKNEKVKKSKGVMNMKVNWKQKLTSRKFWAALTGFVTAILVAFKVPDLTIEYVVAIISASATMIAYIIGEGMVDFVRIGSDKVE